jgi:hypothetical protein
MIALMKIKSSFVPQALLTLLVSLTCSGVSHAVAGDIYVVAHPDTKVTVDVIRDIFIGEKQFSGAVKIIPIDNAAAQPEFLDKVIKLDQTRYANLWVKKSFRDALNPPAVKNSDKEILDWVRKTPGAIGYVTSAPPAGIIVVQKF